MAEKKPKKKRRPIPSAVTRGVGRGRPGGKKRTSPQTENNRRN